MRTLKVGRKATAMTALAILATTLVAAALTDTAAHATVPGPNGLIVYQATVGKHIQLFTVKPEFHFIPA